MKKTTTEIQKEINGYFSIINGKIDDAYQISGLHDLFFKESNDNYLPGTYVFSDKEGYHLDMVGDRGGIVENKTFSNIEDLYFELCWQMVSEISTNYASKNRKEGEDWRRIMFSKRIELLNEISEKFALHGKKKIDDILSENPYDDELLG